MIQMPLTIQPSSKGLKFSPAQINRIAHGLYLPVLEINSRISSSGVESGFADDLVSCLELGACVGSEIFAFNLCTLSYGTYLA